MSAYRDSLPPEQRPLFDAAITQAAAARDQAEAGIHERYAAGGAMAVAEAAWNPLGRPLEGLAAMYEQARAEGQAARRGLAGEDSAA